MIRGLTYLWLLQCISLLGCDDRKATVETIENVDVWGTDSCGEILPRPTAIGHFPAGTKLLVTSRTYGKDFMCLHVQSASGQVGYIMNGSKMVLKEQPK